jgi:SAM-dependent methyltransferase
MDASMFMGYSDNFYKNIHADALSSAEEIVPFVLKLTGAKSVVDVGCGQGAWLSVFKKHGMTRILGLDGAYVSANSLLIGHDEFRAVDLSRPPESAGKFDLVVSLEVGEHIPSASAQAYVTFLASLAPIALFSAAIPFQDGTHHVNEQWPDYWAALFAERGYMPVDAVRPAFWNNEKVAPWYRQNMLIYVKQDKLASYPTILEKSRPTDDWPLSLVHPALYLRSNVKPMGPFWRLLKWLPRLAALKLLRSLEK